MTDAFNDDLGIDVQATVAGSVDAVLRLLPNCAKDFASAPPVGTPRIQSPD